jgi:hypothetical protein
LGGRPKSYPESESQSLDFRSFASRGSQRESPV